MKMKRHTLRGLTALTLAAATAILPFSLGGCGTAADGTGTRSTNGTTAGNTSSDGMGRYVETLTDMSERAENSAYYDWILTALDDGTLNLHSVGVGTDFGSADNGETWQESELASMRDFAGDYYVVSCAVAPDGSAALAYNSIEADTEVSSEPEAYYELRKADGTVVSLSLPWTGNDYYGTGYCFDENGALYVWTYGTDVYEIDTATGEAMKKYSLEQEIGYLQIQNGIILCANGTELGLYSLDDGTRIEDDILTEFAAEHCSFDNTGTGRTAYAFFGQEENTVYVACSEGLYRHVIGGSAMEQVIDGSLCSLSNPSYGIMAALETDDAEFLLVYSGGQLARYVYDADVSAVPENQLTVYSLQESSSVQQAILAYQNAHPDVYVNYEIGMEELSVTREDALKNLNTQLLAGEGPDVLILDGLPLDSYIEKGVLLDLSGTVAELPLYENLIRPFYQGTQIYAVPNEFQLPLIAGEPETVATATDYESLASALESLRAQYPDGALISGCTPKAILKLFSLICEPAWTDAEGNADSDAIREFLAQSKHIYDAQLQGVSQEAVDSYQEQATAYAAEYGTEIYDDSQFTILSPISYLCGYSRTECGTVYDIYSMTSAFSIARTEGYEDTQINTLDGQSGKVYVPVNLLGVNAASANQEGALAFVEMMLGADQQQTVIEGFPVNSEALEALLADTPDNTGEDGAYIYWASSAADSDEVFEGITYWFTEAEKETLRSWIAAAETPFLQDTTLESAVFSEGEKYLNGEENLDDAVANILKAVSVYQSE